MRAYYQFSGFTQTRLEENIRKTSVNFRSGLKSDVFFLNNSLFKDTQQFPTCQGFIAQLGEQRTGIAGVIGSNLLVALKIFSGQKKAFA